MLSIAGCATAYLLDTLQPLLDAWTLHRSPATAQRASIVSAVVDGAVAVLFVLAVISFLTWTAKARANIAVLYQGPARRSSRGEDRIAIGVWFIPVTNLILPPLQIADLAVKSIGRSRPRCTRRNLAILVWVWWAGLMAALGAIVVGVVAGLDDTRELAGIRAAMLAGQAVEQPLALHLFGRQVALRLPSAALLVLAAALAVVMIAKITSAQYAKVARLRGAPPVPDSWALRAVADDRTVVLPAAALVGLLSDDEGERTTVLPVAALGGTIGA
jgi:hypothetical protein